MRRPTLRDRVFQTWWRISRGATLGVRVVAIDPAGRVGLVRHTYVPGWHFPGGGVEKGETVQEAAVRELTEETGASLIGDLMLKSVHANHRYFPNDHVLVFLGRVEDPPARPRCREIAQVQWSPPDALPEHTAPSVPARLAEILGGASPSLNW